MLFWQRGATSYNLHFRKIVLTIGLEYWREGARRPPRMHLQEMVTALLGGSSGVVSRVGLPDGLHVGYGRKRQVGSGTSMFVN